jgi:D-amino-acid oxidase
MAKILLLGAGIIGLNTALRLALETEHQVSIWASDVSNITSAYAGAFWWPTKSITSESNLLSWSTATFHFLYGLGQNEGIVNRKIVALEQEACQAPPWFQLIPGGRLARQGEVTPLLPYGLVLESGPVIEPITHLKWLRDRLEGLGVSIKSQSATSLSESLSECPIVINCTGLGARQLCDDHDLHPVSGQLVKIRNTTVHSVTFIGSRPEKTAYVIPHEGYTILGGTYFAGDADTQPNEDEILAILARCNQLCPQLGATKSDIIGVSKALRPARSQLRLELEERKEGLVIHNYGQGGAGFSLAYGCAGEVIRLLQNACQK